MDKKYKIIVLNGLYGLMEGSAKSLQELLIRRFKRQFDFEPQLTITQTNKVNDKIPSSWIGTMTAILTIDGEVFEYTRDWGAEYEIDIKHPDYHSDEWFYESGKSQAEIKYKEVVANLT